MDLNSTGINADRVIRTRCFSKSLLWAMGVAGVSLIATVICAFTAPACYDMLFLLPATYSNCALFLLLPLKNTKGTLTIKIFTICAFLRYVILPVLLCFEPIYGFSHYNSQDAVLLSKACFLMSYELIIVTAFLLVVSYIQQGRRKRDQLNPQRSGFNNNQIRAYLANSVNSIDAIVIFIMFSVLIAFMFPIATRKISFGILSAGTDFRIGRIESTTLSNMLQQIIHVGILSTFVVLCIRCYKRYVKTSKRKYVYLACLGAMAVTMVIVSEQRSGQIYTAFACLMLLRHCFPKYKKMATRAIIIVSVTVLVFMTLYKGLYVFNYSNYTAALSNSDIGLERVVNSAEVYLLGPQTVSAAINFADNSSVDFLALLPLDFAKSTIGISFFVDGVTTHTTSVLYNLFVTGGVAVNGYLLPITAQGYMCLGFILSPIIICLFYLLALKIESLMTETSFLYVKFFAAYVYIRVATCIVSSNMNSVLTAASIVVISAGLVFLMQRIFDTMLRRK